MRLLYCDAVIFILMIPEVYIRRVLLAKFQSRSWRFDLCNAAVQTGILESCDGICIHLSHGMANGQIASIPVDERRHVVNLVAGGQLPVSKMGAVAMRDAGSIA